MKESLMDRRRFLKLSGVAAATVALGGSISSLAGCGSDKNVGEGVNRTINIGIWGGVLDDAPLAAAYEMGVAEELGIDVKLVPIWFDTYPAMLEKKELDAMIYAVDSLKQIEQGVPLTVINGCNTGCLRYVVAPDSPIKTIKDLKGKKVAIDAVDSCIRMCMSVALENAGVDADSVDWVVYDSTAAEAALVSGEIDCFGGWDPTIPAVVENGNGRYIWQIAEEEPFNKMVMCFTEVSNTTLKEDPEVVKAIDEFISRGNMLCKEKPAEVAKILAEKGYVEESAEFCQKCLESYVWWDDPKVAGESWRYFIDKYAEYGFFEDTTDPDELFNHSYVNPDDL